MKRNERGFTLLELMITVGIVAALTAMAVAGYGFATLKTRRAAAQGCLTEWAGQLERYYTTAMTYQSGPPAAMSYTLRAVPKNGQRKDKCGTMTLNEKNVHTPTTAGCW